MAATAFLDAMMFQHPYWHAVPTLQSKGPDRVVLRVGETVWRELEESEEEAARQAVDFFAYHCAGEIASLATTLGGIDALIFTAGIGEHSPGMRAHPRPAGLARV